MFWPAAHLSASSPYTATIGTGADSVAGVPLAADHTWRFTTGTTVAPGLPVNLGTAGNFVVLAKSGISNVPTSAVTGDLGVSPTAAPPTPANLTGAVHDMELAFTDAAGRAPDVTSAPETSAE